MSNILIKETSPYLLQHSNNPVEWLPWNDKTLKKVGGGKRPVILSIGYSSCHWCHVMAHESFEDLAISTFMNENFISIKVDREEKPDIDHLYQTSLALMGQQGGWPLTMFLDNKLRPFWGGTYFPNTSKHGLPSFIEVLQHVLNVYKNQKESVLINASAVTKALISVFENKNPLDYSIKDLEKIKINLNNLFDPSYGGLAGAPKFPMPPLLRTILTTSFKKNLLNTTSVENVSKTLTAVCLGGIFDHIGGGFARYSTDEYWLVPHFEKMLYDNAQLIELLSVLNLLKPSALYKDRVEKTLAWLQNEMRLKARGGSAYFSAIDADSEGKEGLYYIWEYDEILNILKDDFTNFKKEYGLQEGGNWESKIIINRINKNSKDEVKYDVSSKNKKLLSKLLNARNKKPSPEIDKKILTDWNAMLIVGFLRAYTSFDNPEYLKEAKNIMSYILENHYVGDELYHSSCNGVLGALATIDDYAFLIKAALTFYELENNNEDYLLAKKLQKSVFKKFFDQKSLGFFYSDMSKNDLFVMNKNNNDNVIQSGSGLMLENIYRLFFYSGDKKNLELVEKTVRSGWGGVMKNPISYTSFLNVVCLMLDGYQIVVLKKNDYFGNLIQNVLAKTLPFVLVNYVEDPNSVPKDSPAYNKGFKNNCTTVYVCSGFTCSSPMINIEDMKDWFKKNTLLDLF